MSADDLGLSFEKQRLYDCFLIMLALASQFCHFQVTCEVIPWGLRSLLIRPYPCKLLDQGDISGGGFSGSCQDSRCMWPGSNAKLLVIHVLAWPLGLFSVC